MEPQAIKAWRKAHKVKTQEDLAGHLGVTRSTVARWETGAHKPDGNMLELALEGLERRFAKQRTLQSILGG